MRDHERVKQHICTEQTTGSSRLPNGGTRVCCEIIVRILARRGRPNETVVRTRDYLKGKEERAVARPEGGGGKQKVLCREGGIVVWARS